MSFSEQIQKKLLESSATTYITITSIPFLLYILTVSPSIYWRDSPEFIDIAYTFGISHPAGSPAYSTIGKIFTFLPFFSIPFKINLLSLTFALLTILITCKIIQNILFSCYPTIKKAETNLIILLCSLLLTTMPSFWLKAIMTEVYTINAFFLVLILYFLLKFSIKNDCRYLLLAAFFYGLSSGVHAGVALFLPGFILYFFLVQPSLAYQYEHTSIQRNKFINSSSLKLFSLVCFFFLLGFSIYLYLPIRSIANPEFDWGNPENIRNFYSHITNKKDAGSYFETISNTGALLKDMFVFLKMAMSEITLIGVFLLILGMGVHYKKDVRSFLLLGLTAFVNLLFYFIATFGDTKDGNLFIPSFLVFIIWIGLGIYFIRNAKVNISPLLNSKKLSVPIIMLFIIFSVLINYKRIEKSNYYLTNSIVKETYIDLEANSILFSHQNWFPNRYFQDVENLRQDLIILHINDIKHPDIFNPVTKVRYPMLNFPEKVSAKDSFYDFWPLLINENINERKMFVDLNLPVLNLGFLHILPYKKFLMTIVDEEQEKSFDNVAGNYFKELKMSIDNDISQNAFFLDQEEGVKTYYNVALVSLSNFLRKKNKCDKALSFLKLAESLTDGERKAIPLMKGICLAELGRYDESAIIFKNLLSRYTDDKSVLINIGNLYFKMKAYEKAEKYVKKAIATDNRLPKAHFLLGMIYDNENRIEESIVEIKKAINKTKNPLRKNKMENYLNNVLKR